MQLNPSPAHSTLHGYVLAATVAAMLGGLFIPQAWIQGHLWGFAIVLILGGIPHGASDYLVFRELVRNEDSAGGKLKFMLYYLGVTIAYGLLWWFSPLAAFGLFILISLYHFGQSNWQYVDFPGRLREVLTYLLWGALVVGFPVLLYQEEASLIILEITGQKLNMLPLRWPAIFLIVLANLVNAVHLFEAELIDSDALRRELFNILVLVGLFSATPLLVGFGIYFLGWHSLGSIRDQIAIFRSHNRHYDFRQYLLKMAPLTLGALAGLGILYWWLGEAMDRGLNLGVLFLFLSIITVPHSILMDRFYLSRTETTKNIEDIS